MAISASHLSALPAPFDTVAERYDETFSNSRIGTAQRKQVWRELDRRFACGQRVLEINCGTGVDAAHLAERGIEVWACDSSAAMLEIARRRLSSLGLAARVHLQQLPSEDLGSLEVGASFEGAFSNFGGLNCAQDLAAVARSLSSLLKPGVPLVLCVMSRYVGWEMAWFAVQGRMRQAVRRLGRQPVRLKLGDDSVDCWYRTVRSIRRAFCPHFRLRRWRGVGVTIPPSYLERQAASHPRVMRVLERLDPYAGRIPLLHGLADHLLLTFERC